MAFTWFKVFNADEFLALDVPSKEYELNLVGYGIKTVMATKGINLAVVFEDVILPVKFADKNPWTDGGYAVFYDSLHDVYLGFEVT